MINKLSVAFKLLRKLKDLIGKLNFNEEDLLENIKAFYNSIHKNKPDTIKGSFIKKVTIASTMGFGLEINAGDLR